MKEGYKLLIAYRRSRRYISLTVSEYKNEGLTTKSQSFSLKSIARNNSYIDVAGFKIGGMSFMGLIKRSDISYNLG